MLQLEKITAGYDSEDIVVDFSLTLSPGEALCLYGPSGMGKTTILMTAARLLTPRKGRVINRFTRPAFVFQDERLLPWLNAKDNIKLALKHLYSAEEAEERAMLWLKKLSLEKAADKLPRELSGGMQRRVNIARALSITPDFLMLDEAFSFLDKAMAAHCAAEIVQWREENHGSILAISHDLKLTAPLEAKNLLLDNPANFPRLLK